MLHRPPEANLYEGSFTLQWHITHRCNLRCRHCYQEDYSAFESRADMERILDQYRELLSAYRFRGYLNVTGGEPLTHPDFFWLLEEAAKRGMITGVLTNGTLIGLREARLLRACRVDYVQVSLDGCREVHDSIRGEGSFERAVKGINSLKSQGLFTTVSFTAQHDNRRELKPLARFCDRLCVDKLWFDRVIIPAQEDSEGLSLSGQEYGRLLKTAAHLDRSGKLSCGRALQFIHCHRKQIYRCTAGDRLMAVLADGSVMPCRRLPLTVGNVKDSTLLQLYRDNAVMQQLRGTPVPEACQGCRYAEQCHGGAKCVTYARTGRYDLPDPDCPF